MQIIKYSLCWKKDCHKQFATISFKIGPVVLEIIPTDTLSNKQALLIYNIGMLIKI